MKILEQKQSLAIENKGLSDGEAQRLGKQWFGYNVRYWQEFQATQIEIMLHTHMLQFAFTFIMNIIYLSKMLFTINTCSFLCIENISYFY